MSPWLHDESKSTPKYHEIAYMKTPTKRIAADDSLLLSLEAGLKPRGGERTIELGCGSGMRSLHLAKRHSLDLVLVDFSEGAIRLARDNARRLNFSCHLIRCELRNLPLKDALFDIVWAEGTHEHVIVSQRKRAFAETRRIAKKGARLMIFVPNTLNPIYRIEELVKDRTHLAELYEVPFTNAELRASVANAQFKLVNQDGLEVFYTLFTYSLYDMNDVPPVLKPIYSVKRFLTRTHLDGSGLVASVLRAFRKFDRSFLPRHALGHEIAIVAEAI